MFTESLKVVLVALGVGLLIGWALTATHSWSKLARAAQVAAETFLQPPSRR